MKNIYKPYNHSFTIQQSGLVGIFVSSRCKSRKQLSSGFDENLRIEIDALRFREILPDKYVQLFNVPAAWNGSTLKGLKKTLIFLTILEKGDHVLTLVPDPTATIEDIAIHELRTKEALNLDINEQAEDGDRRPWYTVALIDLPLRKFSLETTVAKRFRDSDDVQVLIDGAGQRKRDSGKYFLWYVAGGLLKWIIRGFIGVSEKKKADFSVNLDSGIHYVELFADRKPVLHTMTFYFGYQESESEKRAANLVRTYRSAILSAAKEFDVDPVMIGAAVYQEQATNVNFIDHLTDYIGGLLHLNTSIGIGQVRVSTAQSLEKIYPKLFGESDQSLGINKTFVTVERLKDPWLNLRYVAAKIHFSIEHWKRAGYNIGERHDIVGTLYNIEEVDDAKEPRSNPEPNDFGIGVEKNYNNVKKMLGI